MESPLIELDLFRQPVLENAIKHGYWKSYTPVNRDPNVGSLEFNIDESEQSLDLNDTILHLQMQVKRADAKTMEYKDLAANDDVGLINFPMHTIFSDIEISLNNKKIEGGEGDYSYRSYLSSLIMYSPQCQ